MSSKTENVQPSLEKVPTTVKSSSEIRVLLDRIRTKSMIPIGIVGLLGHGALGFKERYLPPSDLSERNTTQYTPGYNDTDYLEDQIRHTMGDNAVENINIYTNADAKVRELRDAALRPESPLTTYTGFERIGMNSEQVQELMTILLPQDWLSQTNISSISVENAAPDMHYTLTGEYEHSVVLGTCSHSRELGEPSEIKLYKDAIEASRRARPHEDGQRSTLVTLVHEIAHANAPNASSTMENSSRLWSMHWVMRRVENLSTVSTDEQRFVHAVQNAIQSFPAEPALGEGALPLSYPSAIEMYSVDSTRVQNYQITMANRFVEYYAELLATVLMLRFAPVADRPWDIQAAEALLKNPIHNMNLNYRTQEDALNDALAHIHFVQLQIPDLEDRITEFNRKYDSFVLDE